MRRRFRKSLIIIVSIVVILIIGGVVLKFGGIFAPQKIYGLSGTIKTINNDNIIVDAIISFKNGKIKNETKTILIDANTKITALKIPLADGNKIPRQIQPIETEIKITDLQVNNKIDVAIDSENQKNLTAKTIKLIQ